MIITGSGLLLRPNSEAIFRTLLVRSVRRKGGREGKKGGKSHWVLFREASGCSDLAALKREAKGRIVPQ